MGMTDKQQVEAREIIAEIVAMEPLRDASGFQLECDLCWSSWHHQRQETHAPGCIKRRAPRRCLNSTARSARPSALRAGGGPDAGAAGPGARRRA